MRLKVMLAALATAALCGSATTAAADHDAYYRQGYYPDRSYTYSSDSDRTYTYYYYPDRGYYYRDNNPYYGYGDPHRNHVNEYSYKGYDRYGIESHDTN